MGGNFDLLHIYDSLGPMGWMEGLPRYFIGSCDSSMERAEVSELWS